MFTVKNHVYTVEYGGYSGVLSTLPESIINGLTKKAKEGNIVGVTDTNTGAAYFYTIVDGELSEIGNSGSGGGNVERKDLNFFDYDGTLLYSYTKEEAALLTALPANPRHGGLVAQGWNWTLEDIHTQMEQVGVCDAGQLYITDDGKTRLYCEFSGFKSPTIGFAVDGSCVIDWGDGSEPNTVQGDSSTTVIYTSHEYARQGKYLITLESVEGTIYIRGSADLYTYLFGSAYRSFCYRVELGAGIELDTYGLYSMRSLDTITVPRGLYFRTRAFSGCVALKFIVLENITGTYSLANCTYMKGFSIGPNSLSLSTYTFHNDYHIVNAVLPYDTTLLSQYLFDSCYSITKIYVPSTVNSIQAHAFYSCVSLSDIYMLPTTPPTLSSVNAFSGVSENCKIHVPAESLNAYQTATNWSSYAAYMVGDL